MSAIFEYISQRVWMDVIDSVEKRTFLKELFNYLKINCTLLFISYLLIYIFDSLLLLKFKWVSLTFDSIRKFSFLLENSFVVFFHIVYLLKISLLSTIQPPFFQGNIFYLLLVVISWTLCWNSRVLEDDFIVRILR